MRFVVTGANRGIGLELARQLVERGHTVEGTTRGDAPALAALGCRVHRVDVTDQASVDAMARAITEPVDVLINNAGINLPAQHLHDLDLAATAKIIDVNAIGALRVTHALLPHIRRGTARMIVHVSSGMGSIADNKRGASYGYRMSKAALNMMAMSLAVDLRPEGIISFVINPGWVKTDLGGDSAPLDPATSVRGILNAIDNASLETSGTFQNWNGGTYPW